METMPQDQSDEDLGPAGFFDAVSEEYRPLAAGPAIVLYLAVPLLAVPALIVAAAVVPVVLAVRVARGQQARVAAGALLRTGARLVSSPRAQRGQEAPPEGRRMTPYSATVARSLTVARAGLRSG